MSKTGGKNKREKEKKEKHNKEKVQSGGRGLNFLHKAVYGTVYRRLNKKKKSRTSKRQQTSNRRGMKRLLSSTTLQATNLTKRKSESNGKGRGDSMII